MASTSNVGRTSAAASSVTSKPVAQPPTKTKSARTGLNSFAAMMRSSRFWLAMKFIAQEFFEFLFGQFALADTTVTKSIHQRQLLVQCGIAQRRVRHGLIERCECDSSLLPFRVWPNWNWFIAGRNQSVQ